MVVPRVLLLRRLLPIVPVLSRSVTKDLERCRSSLWTGRARLLLELLPRGSLPCLLLLLVVRLELLVLLVDAVRVEDDRLLDRPFSFSGFWSGIATSKASAMMGLLSCFPQPSLKLELVV